MLRIEGFYTSNPNRRVSVNKGNNPSVAEATTSSKKEAGARKHRSFNAAMELILETPGYIKAMGELVSTQLILKAAPKIAARHLCNEDTKAFNAKVSLIYDGYVEQIIRTHLLDAAYGCWAWRKNEVASLLNGYKSQALRDADKAKGAEKVALYKIANFCEKKWVVEKLTESLNNIIEDVFAMEDLCIEGFEAILASKYSKLF